MSALDESGYTNVTTSPNKYDTYLVKTRQGVYDFALYINDEWEKGIVSSGDVLWWMPIPQIEY